jgi:hypothetical protein
MLGARVEIINEVLVDERQKQNLHKQLMDQFKPLQRETQFFINTLKKQSEILEEQRDYEKAKYEARLVERQKVQKISIEFIFSATYHFTFFSC